MEKISRGPTFSGGISITGIVLFFISIIFFFGPLLIVVLGLVLMSISIILFLAIEGTLIDHENNRIKSYNDFVFIKIGEWLDLDSYNKITLRFESSSQTMNYQSLSSTIQTRSFDIYLTGDKVDEIYLKEFTKYGEGKSFLYLYAEKLKKETFDEYEEIFERIQEMRRERDRERENK